MTELALADVEAVASLAFAAAVSAAVAVVLGLLIAFVGGTYSGAVALADIFPPLWLGVHYSVISISEVHHECATQIADFDQRASRCPSFCAQGCSAVLWGS